MSRWTWSSPASTVNINKPRAYYFLTSDRWEKGCFKFYSAEVITITTEEIKTLPEPGKFATAIPREHLLKLNPGKDFTLKIKLINNKTDSSTTFKEIPLGSVLNSETYGYPEKISLGIITAMEPTLDLGKSLVILSSGTHINKSVDKDVSEKILKCMHEAIAKVNRTANPEFIMEIPEFTVRIGVGLSQETRDKFTGKEVGTFKVPDNASIPPEESEINKK